VRFWRRSKEKRPEVDHLDLMRRAQIEKLEVDRLISRVSGSRDLDTLRETNERVEGHLDNLRKIRLEQLGEGS
jgi:hypothetical protein